MNLLPVPYMGIGNGNRSIHYYSQALGTKGNNGNKLAFLSERNLFQDLGTRFPS